MAKAIGKGYEIMSNPNQNFRDLTVYKKAFDLAMEIFEVSKLFLKEERYSLTDQIRRSSRAVCSCIAEAYRKRNYQASTSSDSDMENSETQTWLDFSKTCKYIDEEKYMSLLIKSDEVGRMLNHMIDNPEKYLRQKERTEMAE